MSLILRKMDFVVMETSCYMRKRTMMDYKGDPSLNASALPEFEIC